MFGTTANTYRHVDRAPPPTPAQRPPAGVVVAVGEDDHGRATGTIREPIRCLTDRVVQGRGPEWRNRLELAWKVFQAICERRHLGQPRVEREDGGFVLRLVEPAEHVAGGIAGIGKPRFHAAADVEEQGHADLAAVGPEFGDLAGDAAVEHFEVADRQIADETALPVADNCVQVDEVFPDLKVAIGLSWAARKAAGGSIKVAVTPIVRMSVPRAIARLPFPSTLPNGEVM
jgi:hypothetical protein